MKILLPIDGSELSLHEVRFALQLVAQGLRADFLLVNVQEPATLYEMVTAPDPAVLEQVSQSAGTHLLEPAAALLRSAGVGCELAVASGDAAHAIRDLVETYGCEMIIIGTRGAGLLRTALQGSVAQRLLQEAPVPVLMVQPPEPAEPAETDEEEVGSGEA